MDIKTRIESCQVNLKKADQARTIAQTQQASVEEQMAAEVAKMTELGVTPETIDQEIKQLESSINEDLTKVEELTPKV